MKFDLGGFIWGLTSGKFSSTIPEPLFDIFSSRYSLTVLRALKLYGFYRATCMHSKDYAVAIKMSVRLSVCGHRWTYPQIFFSSGSPHYSSFFSNQTGWQYSNVDPLLTAASNTRRIWKSHDFRPIALFMSEMMQDRAIVTMEHEYDTAHKLSNSTSLDDLEWPLTHISRWQYYATSTNSKVIVTDLSEIPKALWNNKSVQLFVQNFELVSKGRGKDGSEKKGSAGMKWNDNLYSPIRSS